MPRARFEIAALDDDGLTTPEVGDWSEDKYRLVNLYTKLFTMSMRAKWEVLVYLDLFAGAGRSRIRDTSRILPASPTLALQLDPPFDRYIFCEHLSDRLEALRTRVKRDFPSREVAFVDGDVNEKVPDILEALPSHSSGRRVLTFCFVDPYRLKDLHFDTIKKLSARYMDFLVLIPTGYDATRNEWLYTTDTESTVVANFLGSGRWQESWTQEKARGTSFDAFITDSFGASMQSLDYIYPGVADTQLIRLTGKNVPLYRLALFSRHPLGAKFWRQVRKYAPDQRSLF